MRTERRHSRGTASVETILILPFLLTFVILAREAAELSVLKQELIVSARTNAWDLALNGRCNTSLDQFQRSWLPADCNTDGTGGTRFIDEMQTASTSTSGIPSLGTGMNQVGFPGSGPSGITKPLRNVRGPEISQARMQAPFPWLGNEVPTFMQPNNPPLGVMMVEDQYQVSANRVWVSADDDNIWHDRAKLETGYDAVLRDKLNPGLWEIGRSDRFFKHLFPKLGQP